MQTGWTVQVLKDIRQIESEEWDRLNPNGNPFVGHAFLSAMENNGCVGIDAGWEPTHLCLTDAQGTLIGAMPLYLKYNSYGEFVFDWSWASAYEQHGLSYYPKLVSAAPYSPVPGPRFLISEDIDFADAADELLDFALKLATEKQASSLHFLFANQRDIQILKKRGFMLRQDCQFLWKNNDYEDFDDFVGKFRSSKRKKLNRERRRVTESGISFVTRTGDTLDSDDWKYLYRFYCSSYLIRGRQPYLSKPFFVELSKALGTNLVALIAQHSETPVAAAILIRDKNRLYGRYWGSDADFHSLHFETCYYQGIEYAIRNKLEYFEPGTQGEHKLVRGFAPTLTHSAHWIAHPGFARAINEHLKQERLWVNEYVEQCRQHLPFRREEL